MTPERIPIIVDDNPTIITPLILEDTPENQHLRRAIVKRAVEAQKVHIEKNNQKRADERQMQSVYLQLLEAPKGLTQGEILAATDSVNLISVLGRIRGYLKHNGLYTLEKRRIEKENRYYLDPVR